MMELNENDNLGARYFLMGIYAILEEKEAMEQLLEKYPMVNPYLSLSNNYNK